jgi:3-dehydroquinate dehydratase-2
MKTLSAAEQVASHLREELQQGRWSRVMPGRDRLARELGVELEMIQSNHEGDLLDFIQEMRPDVHGYVVNAGALTHTSVALRDGLVGSGLPFVEVHLSNTAALEPFRHTSYLAGVALGVVAGFGPDSYLLGLQGLVSHLRERGETNQG